MIGTILGDRYEIIEEVGKGGMAHVYKARCTLLNRIVAVKILRDDLDGENEFLKRFNVEAQAAASLTHPNIVSIFDVGCDNGRHYIIMEYVDGITLKEYISEKGKLPYKDALSVAYQISDALQAAHRKNIVHRDVKPHNILITNEGKIKVTDFGIARSGNHKTLSSNDDILGSVHYISPEQAKGETVDTRSDIYSLGIVMYEMITGSLPFDGDTPVAVAMKQIEEKPSNELFEQIELPLSVRQIVFKSMDKTPELRYQNADEIKLDILNVLENPNYTIKDGFLYTDSDNFGKNKKTVKKEVKPVKSKAFKAFLIFAALLSSLIIVGSGVYLYNHGINELLSATSGEQTVDVPDLTDMTLKEAQELCDSININVVVDEEVNNHDYAPGCIVSQKPDTNEKIDPDGTIHVVINKSNMSMVLKDYTGMNYTEVEDSLKKEGYTVNVIFEESKKDADLIIRHVPREGGKLRKDSSITLYVSRGLDTSDEYTTVPDLIGNTYAQGEKMLKDIGLKISYTGKNRPSDSAEILSQTIPAGSLVTDGCVISVTVQEAIEETGAQDDTGTDEAE